MRGEVGLLATPSVKEDKMKSKRLLLVSVCGLGLILTLLVVLNSSPLTISAASTDWFVSVGGAGTCAQNDPCALEMAIAQAQYEDTIYVAGGTYTGTGAAVITITRSITLYGGWDGAGSGAVARDPVVYPTTLDGQNQRRVVYISGNITPTLAGFIIARGNATGLTAGCPSNPDGCGGGIFVHSAHPLIINSVITNNVAAITTIGNPTVAIGYGGGLFLRSADRAVISGNLIISNAASTAYWGLGGGLYVRGSANGMQVRFNRVFGNAATTTDAVGEGGGIYGGPDDVLIQGNVFVGNQTNSAGVGRGAGLFQYGGFAHYLGNLVQENYGSNAVGLHYSQARFEGNRVVDNATSEGIRLQNRSGNGPVLINNVVARSGDRTLAVEGHVSDPMEATLLHNTLVGAGSGYGIYGSYATLYLTNTIVASTTWGIVNNTPASSTVLADHTLFWANTNDGIQGANPVLNEDPAFVNPAVGNYHIGPGSAAIDAGITTIVTTDLDGDRRPIGPLPDIGADEAPRWAFLPLVLRN
jgi:hypothetical protein